MHEKAIYIISERKVAPALSGTRFEHQLTFGNFVESDVAKTLRKYFSFTLLTLKKFSFCSTGLPPDLDGFDQLFAYLNRAVKKSI